MSAPFQPETSLVWLIPYETSYVVLMARPREKDGHRTKPEVYLFCGIFFCVSRA